MLINIHTHFKQQIPNVIGIVNQYPLDLDITLPTFSVGIHPWYIQEETLQRELNIMERQIGLPGFFAVGECGLDKNSQASMELQMQVLTRQLLLAQKYSKPVILHMVSDFQLLFELKRKLSLTIPLIVHGFRKSKELGRSLQNKGFYLSFGSALLKSVKLQQVFMEMDKNYVFLENDNDAACKIEDLYAKAKGLEENIQDIIERNYKNVFNK